MISLGRDIPAWEALLARGGLILLYPMNLWRAKRRSGLSFLWDQRLATDLAKQDPELDIPANFLHGIYEYTCSYTEAESDFE